MIDPAQLASIRAAHRYLMRKELAADQRRGVWIDFIGAAVFLALIAIASVVLLSLPGSW